MKITILGCGAAGGVPMISSGWGECDPDEPKNRRRRPSILIESDGKTVLIDTSPDLRDQLLGAGVRRLDAVLYTHAHADHLHGIDDLREVNRAMRAPIDVYGSRTTLDEIDARFGYVFTPLTVDLQAVADTACHRGRLHCRRVGFHRLRSGSWLFPHHRLSLRQGCL